MASSGIMVNSRTALTFPCTLTLSRINAEFKDGVITTTLPKTRRPDQSRSM